jgi:hypothetical protein
MTSPKPRITICVSPNTAEKWHIYMRYKTHGKQHVSSLIAEQALLESMRMDSRHWSPQIREIFDSHCRTIDELK